MFLIDTHTHPYVRQFDNDRDAVMQRAIASGVRKMIVPNCAPDTISPLKALAARYPDVVYMAMGLHPTDIDPENWQEDLQIITDELKAASDNYIAIGEIGMDLYWDKSYTDIQMQVFDRQLSLAGELRLPVIIHCREALDQTLEVLSGHPDVRCDFHCFTGNTEDVEAIRRLGDHYFGIGGVVTFRNSSALREALPVIGLDRILLETDAPYLAPVPWRGKRNEPAYIHYTADCVATTMGETVEKICEVTSENAKNLFGLQLNI